ncbi:MAG: hypothetical protein ACXWZT_13875 [Gaiellaceae bacterium]
MDAAAVSRLKPVASELLLQHCSALDSHDGRRPAATARLDALLGRDLARRLVQALSSRAS